MRSLPGTLAPADFSQRKRPLLQTQGFAGGPNLPCGERECAFVYHPKFRAEASACKGCVAIPFIRLFSATKMPKLEDSLRSDISRF